MYQHIFDICRIGFIDSDCSSTDINWPFTDWQFKAQTPQTCSQTTVSVQKNKFNNKYPFRYWIFLQKYCPVPNICYKKNLTSTSLTFSIKTQTADSLWLWYSSNISLVLLSWHRDCGPEMEKIPSVHMSFNKPYRYNIQEWYMYRVLQPTLHTYPHRHYRWQSQAVRIQDKREDLKVLYYPFLFKGFG